MKRMFSFLAVALAAISLCATPHAPKNMASLPTPTIVKGAPRLTYQTARPATSVQKAPAATLDADLSKQVAYVEAAYYGTDTGDQTDWIIFFASAANELVAGIDIYDIADPTHIDGNYSTANGSIGLDYSSVQTNAGEIGILSATLTVSHNTFTDYHFALSAVGEDGETYYIDGNFTVDAYDAYLYQYYNYFGIDPTIYLEDAGTNPGGNGGSTTTGPDYSLEPTTPTTVSATFSGDDAEWDYDYLLTYGDIDLYLENTTEAAFYFYVPASTTENDPLPAGTYTINDSGDEWTVEMSSGLANYQGTYYPTPAYFATFDAEGYYETIYYIVSGSATVSYDAQGKQTIVVNGVSGNGSTVTITYTSGNSPVTPPIVEGINDLNATTTATKHLENNQLIIRKNGIKYNVLGAEIR